MQTLVERVIRRSLRAAGYAMVPISDKAQAYIVHPDAAIGRLKERGDGVRHMGLVATAATTLSLHDPKFLAAIEAAKLQDPHTSVGDFMLRVYYEIMFFGLTRHLPGAAMAVGVAYGKSPRAIFEYFDGIGDKSFILVDPWEKQPRENDPAGITYCHDHHDMLSRMGRWQNSIVPVVGFAPDALNETGTGPLSYVNLNVTIPDVELASFAHLYDRVVPGGVVMIPYFAWQGTNGTEARWIEAAASRSQSFIWLPTGQGVMIKS